MGSLIKRASLLTMSALTPKADIGRRCRNVRLVPIADIQRDDAPFSIADFAVLGRSYSVSADVRLVFLNDI